jgi:hypothetical protein
LDVWLFGVIKLGSAKDAQAVCHYVEFCSQMNLVVVLLVDTLRLQLKLSIPVSKKSREGSMQVLDQFYLNL